MILFAFSVESSCGYRYTLSDCENVFHPIPAPLVSPLRLVLSRRKVYLLGIANSRRTSGSVCRPRPRFTPETEHRGDFQALVTHGIQAIAHANKSNTCTGAV